MITYFLILLTLLLGLFIAKRHNKKLKKQLYDFYKKENK